MTNWFPSEEWLAAYRTNLNGSDRYRRESEGWGVEFDGRFVFEIRRLPVEETTLGEFPDELSEGLGENLSNLPEERATALVEDAPETLRERTDYGDDGDDDRERLLGALFATPIVELPDAVRPPLREEFPGDLANLLDQLERYVEDGTVRVYLDLRDGNCREAEVLEPGDERDVGFVLRGDYPEWKNLTEGADVMGAVLGEHLDLDGSVTTVMNYADAADEMGVVASRIESASLFVADS
ncbi:SCP2 sterol-binding domain-containing protein [Haladaptatus salinisoli]|uniref:SCP2 sterol-binding domain-containing protein n=1 Tax=Haladaptatus salinisoli TaxID=2884876 RepID=UPI001D0BCE8B|nr:SCP2 sterol-binding domain-containing protein [Haladaptatus salinisoli]